MRKKKSKFKKYLLIALTFITTVSLAAAGFIYWAAQDLDSNIKTEKIIESEERVVLRETQRENNEAMNVLIMGSDSRAGDNDTIGGDSPGLSDTAILLHIPENRSFVYGVSIPRDSMVNRPTCATDNGDTPEALAQFNSAYAVGGPTCTVKTIEEVTDVYVDHFMVVDFAGFQKIVDILGGVKMCIAEPINDTVGDIYLEGGEQTLNGEESLGYVRTRYGIGDGSDIGRMARQQEFMKALAQQTLESDLYTKPGRLWDVLSQGTKLLTTDDDFASVYKLSRLALSLKDLNSKDIKLETIPNKPWDQNPNRVIWTEEADTVWAKFRGEEPFFEEDQRAGLSEGVGVAQKANPDITPKESLEEKDEKPKENLGLC